MQGKKVKVKKNQLFTHCFRTLAQATRDSDVAGMLAHFVALSALNKNRAVLEQGRSIIKNTAMSKPQSERALTKLLDFQLVSCEDKVKYRVDVGRICALCEARNLAADKQVQSSDAGALDDVVLGKLNKEDRRHLKGEFAPEEVVRAIRDPEVLRAIQEGLSGHPFFTRVWEICETNQRAPVLASSFLVAGFTSGPGKYCLRFLNVRNHWADKVGTHLTKHEEQSLRCAVRQYTARQLNDMIDFCFSRRYGMSNSLSNSLTAALACREVYEEAWKKYVAAHLEKLGLRPEEVPDWY